MKELGRRDGGRHRLHVAVRLGALRHLRAPPRTTPTRRRAATRYTIEIGPQGGQFHMPYQTGVVDEWTGKRGTPSEGKGMREALLLAAENAAEPRAPRAC